MRTLCNLYDNPRGHADPAAAANPTVCVSCVAVNIDQPRETVVSQAVSTVPVVAVPVVAPPSQRIMSDDRISLIHKTGSEESVFSSTDNLPHPSPKSPRGSAKWIHESFLGRRLFAVKSLKQIQREAESNVYQRTLGTVDLLMLGVGGIIGAGIFVLTGVAARDMAGPAVTISFLLAGIVSTFASLCYAELSAMIPISGSAYSFTFATMGELMAWIIGWDLTLEYLVGAATVAVGWSGYVQTFFADALGVKVDRRLTSAPFYWKEADETGPAGFLRSMVKCGSDPASGNAIECPAYINLPAMLIVLSLTILLIFGIRQSAGANSVFVAIKLTVIILFIFAGIRYINPANYHPFIPPEERFGKYGASGIFQAATTVFFAYIGFDAVSSTAQEAKNPRRDLPIGIIGSLAICTGFYIA
ncbi:Cationic amino acid transporter-1, partial [Quaeritorhiza haematococci]